MDSPINWFQILVNLITPIIVAYFGYRSTRQERESKRILELQQQVREKEKLAEKAEMDKTKKAYEELKEELLELRRDIETLKKETNMTKMETQMKNVIEMTNINFQYCQSLSKVMTSIGKAIESSSLVDNASIDKSIQDHHDQEQEILARLYKIIS